MTDLHPDPGELPMARMSDQERDKGSGWIPASTTIYPGAKLDGLSHAYALADVIASAETHGYQKAIKALRRDGGVSFDEAADWLEGEAFPPSGETQQALRDVEAETETRGYQKTFYAHDADCNTVHVAGSEPCPSPREEGDSLQAALGRAWDAGYRRATSDLAAAEARGREQGRREQRTADLAALRGAWIPYFSAADFLESTGGPECTCPEPPRSSEPSQQWTWEHFAGLLFAYYDARYDADDVEYAWQELAAAIKDYRAVGGIEPRDPDEIDVWLVPESTGGQP